MADFRFCNERKVNMRKNTLYDVFKNITQVSNLNYNTK